MRWITVIISILAMVTTAMAEEMRPKRWAPGEVVPKDYPADATWVQAKEINASTLRRMKGKSYPKGCPIPLEELRLIEVVHSNGKGQRQMGEIIVNKAIADDMVQVFTELEAAGYPIERMVLIDNYDADDDKSMRANNSSGFNYRTVAGTTRLSNHAKGMAVDINPLYNPWVKVKDGKTLVEPETARKYADRSVVTPYTINGDSEAYKIFTRHGFTWGGAWRSIKDYQHFEKKAEKTQRPRALKKGDKVAVVAPASATTSGTRAGLARVLENMGYEPVFGNHTYTRHGTYSGSIEQRVGDLNKMLRDTTVRAIVALRGGYGTPQLFEGLDSAAFKADPKWIVGFSDITALHGWALGNGIQSVHGPVGNQIEHHHGKDDALGVAVDALESLLKTGVQPTITAAAHRHNLHGVANGEIKGGNWIVANDLAETPWELLTAGEDEDVILFFEETNESIHAVERMLVRLHQAGVLKRVRGLVFGNMISYTADQDFKTMEDAIAWHLRRWGYYDDEEAKAGTRPIVFNFPTGHGRHNMPIIEGARVCVAATADGVTLFDADFPPQYTTETPEEEAEDTENG